MVQAALRDERRARDVAEVLVWSAREVGPDRDETLVLTDDVDQQLLIGIVRTVRVREELESTHTAVESMGSAMVAASMPLLIWRILRPRRRTQRPMKDMNNEMPGWRMGIGQRSIAAHRRLETHSP